LYGFYGFDLTNNAKKKYTLENDPLQAQITMREFQFFESIIEKIDLFLICQNEYIFSTSYQDIQREQLGTKQIFRIW
jgi:hypothetical protein